MCVQHLDLLLQHPDEPLEHIRLIQMKHLEHTLEIYLYNHCNMCNISIYFCNIDINTCDISLEHLKHLKHMFCNILFQRKHLLAALTNGGLSARGGHWCARQQRGARRRRTEGKVGAHGRRCRRGRVGGVWRSSVWSLVVRSSPGTRSLATTHRGRCGVARAAVAQWAGGCGSGGAEGPDPAFPYYKVVM